MLSIIPEAFSWFITSFLWYVGLTRNLLLVMILQISSTEFLEGSGLFTLKDLSSSCLVKVSTGFIKAFSFCRFEESNWTYRLVLMPNFKEINSAVLLNRVTIS